MYVCHWESTDGRCFKTGADCAVRAAEAEGDSKLAAQAKGAKRKHDRELRNARADVVAEELCMLLGDSAVQTKLNTVPSPTAWRAAQGETLLTYARWMLGNAGAKGRGELLKKVREALDR